MQLLLEICKLEMPTLHAIVWKCSTNHKKIETVLFFLFSSLYQNQYLKDLSSLSLSPSLSFSQYSVSGGFKKKHVDSFLFLLVFLFFCSLTFQWNYYTTSHKGEHLKQLSQKCFYLLFLLKCSAFQCYNYVDKCFCCTRRQKGIKEEVGKPQEPHNHLKTT